jgi:hypothetical protein
MKAWAIIDMDYDRVNDLSEYRNREIYLLFTFWKSSPVLQVFDYRHRHYAEKAIQEWVESGSHPTAKIVPIEITLNVGDV